ncbi:hypothetical protein C0J45_2040 [Silurus meridionalis]|nr:hypothetical protein C0J45_2040 [Silurus meridionalis]
MEDGPMLRALKTYACRNQAGTFAELHQEALSLEEEYGQTRYETACAAISQRETPNLHALRPDYGQSRGNSGSVTGELAFSGDRVSRWMNGEHADRLGGYTSMQRV